MAKFNNLLDDQTRQEKPKFKEPYPSTCRPDRETAHNEPSCQPTQTPPSASAHPPYSPDWPQTRGWLWAPRHSAALPFA